MHGTTPSGYEYEIDEAVLSDWKFVTLLADFKELEESDSQEIDFVRILSKIEKIMFKDKGKSLEKHIASLNDGHIPTDVFVKEIFDIINARKELKN